MEIRNIRERVRRGKYTVSFSHTERVRLRRISLEDIEEAILNGSVIEQYPDDPRGPSCLILGFSEGGRPLHVVCGNLEHDELLVITAYEPDTKQWAPDMKTRIGEG